VTKSLLLRLFCGTLLLAGDLGLSTVHASPNKEVANSSGGGHAVSNGDLLDFAENVGTTPFFPLKTEGVNEILSQVQAQLPGFAHALKDSLRKSWYLDDKDIAACPGGSESLVDVEGSPVACQNSIEVRISSRWYAQVGVVEERAKLNREGIVIHEMLRNLNLGGRGSEASLRALTRVLCAPVLPDSLTLQRLAKDYGYGEYLRAEDIAGVRDTVLEVDGLLQAEAAKAREAAPLCDQKYQLSRDYFARLKSLDGSSLPDKALRARLQELDVEYKQRQNEIETTLSRIASERRDLIARAKKISFVIPESQKDILAFQNFLDDVRDSMGFRVMDGSLDALSACSGPVSTRLVEHFDEIVKGQIE
jgi:hypothetical protein